MRKPRWQRDDAGRDWLAELPKIIDEQCRRWGLVLDDGQPRHGSNALVVPVLRDGVGYALRLAPPGSDIPAETRALQFWAGHAMVELIDVDLDSCSMLLERLDSERTLGSLPLPEALDVIAGLCRDHALPAPQDIRSTTDIARSHAQTFGRDWRALGGPTSQHQIDIATALAEEAAVRPASDLAVNGDLHCEQFLSSFDGRWVAVDPVLLRGDIEYDVARVLWNRPDDTGDAAATIGLVDRFAAATDAPPDRARSWVILRAMDYLLRGLAQGLDEAPRRCQRLLDVFC